MGIIGLVRHGESEWNREGRIQGTLDIPLSDAGRRQAQEFAWTLQGKPIHRIWTSDLRRAKETGRIIAEELQRQGVPVRVRVLDDLYERHYGRYQGRRLGDLVHRGEFVHAEHLIADGEVEPWQKLEKRVLRAICRLRECAESDGMVLAVVHGGWGKAVCTLLFGQMESHGLGNLQCLWINSSDLHGLCL